MPMRAVRGPQVALLVAVILLGAALGTGAASTDDEPAGRVLNAAVHPLQRTDTTIVAAKVPLAEIFTATWCPPCAPADRALERLIAERNPALAPSAESNVTTDIGFALLSYHPFPDIGGEDILGTPEGHARLAAKHDVFWFPSFYVDGIHEDRPSSRSISVDAGMESILYDSYQRLIDAALQDPVPFTLSVDSIRLQDDPATWQVNVTLVAREDIRRALYVQAALWEDPLDFRGSNGIDEHRMVVRALAPRAPIDDGLQQGEQWTHTWSIEAPRQVNPDAAGITVFVETAWLVEDENPVGLLFALAVAVAATVGVVAAVDVRAQRRRRGARRGKDPEP